MSENNPLPMRVYDGDTLACLDVNDAALARYGYARDEILAMTIQDLRPSANPHAPGGGAPKSASEPDTPELCRHLKKDGTIIDVDVTSPAIQFAGWISDFNALAGEVVAG